MKTIGLIGGTGWVSTQEYYKIINEKVNKKLGGLHFPRIILYSINYGEIYACNQKNDREGVYKIIKAGAETLQHTGIDFLALCANTIHFTFEKLVTEIDLPFVHIADATGKKIKEKKLKKVGLLGTQETMEMDFYKTRLAKIGIEVITPEKNDRNFIHQSIMEELLKEQFLPETKSGFISVMNDLKSKGAEGIILGCTEIPLLIKQKDYDLPLFSTLEIHADAIAEFSLTN
ncbi:aspartate/glutamate racemase family protein [Maribellus maritimus]|uniref:aspartate/glutamate racemase family protein n=1 Tax=Maribellus maritimus TaxID=2870838 RepID=UPI001EEA6069|nr:amino acid racemase [Maribellus maritimus]MCG6187057.1 amino acid racemase [Maribellus maritimus]